MTSNTSVASPHVRQMLVLPVLPAPTSLRDSSLRVSSLVAPAPSAQAALRTPPGDNGKTATAEAVGAMRMEKEL